MQKSFSYYFQLCSFECSICSLCVFNVYIDVIDGRHECEGNMRHWGKKSLRSIKGNFMMNKFLLFSFNKFSVISKTFFYASALFHEVGRQVGKTLNIEISFQFWGYPEWHCINIPQNGKRRLIFSLWRRSWCSHNYIWLLDTIDKDNIIREKVQIWEDP